VCRGRLAAPPCPGFRTCARSTLRRSPLRDRSPLTYANGAQTYKFGLCNNIPGASCPLYNNGSVSFLQDSISLVCLTSYGNAAFASARQLSGTNLPGIAVTYTDPFSSCGAAASTTYYVFCDPSVPGPLVVTLATPSGDCSLQYTIRTGLACPTRPAHSGGAAGAAAARLGAGWIIFILFIAGSVLYVGGGTLYNRWKHGARGIEAIPHIALWRKCIGWVSCSRSGSAFDYTRAGGDSDDHAAYMLPPAAANDEFK
jgi:hypothetical protein